MLKLSLIHLEEILHSIKPRTMNLQRKPINTKDLILNQCALHYKTIFIVLFKKRGIHQKKNSLMYPRVTSHLL